MNKKSVWKFAFACFALVLVFLIAYSGLRILESAVFLVQQEEKITKTKTITRDGIDYFPRQDINVVLLMGIDQEGEAVASPVPNEAPAVDMVTLMIFDEKAQHVTLLSLNRDTMLEMPALDINGWESGVFYGQLAFSHMYGTGLEDSCENTKKTVSAFLNGITIDYYLAMNMDAIALLNDAVGGVTVTVEDDFSMVDPSLTKGEVTLKGEQAVTFVQARKNVGDQLNASRIERHKEYMSEFMTAFRAKAEESDTFVLSAYEEVSPYIVTDCSATVITSLMERYGDYELKETVTPEGESRVGQYMEFYADEEKLDELVLRLFYAPK